MNEKNTTPATMSKAEAAARAAFPCICEQIEKDAHRQMNSRAFYIAHGYCESWDERHKEESDDGLKRYSTPKKWEAYKAGTIDRGQAVKIAVQREGKALAKRTEKKYQQLASAAAETIPAEIYINIEWTKSRTWGANPHAEVRAAARLTTGTASGCGYDKESAAAAEALNANPAIMRAVYATLEKALQDGKRPTEYGNGNNNYSGILGYGAGCGPIPYFEGGVGIESTLNMLKSCGYTTSHAAWGKMYDAYTATRANED